MGLFDFFKDGDSYEGSHNPRRSSARKASFDATRFESNADLVAWLEKNKVILLSEDEGLVVYTNDDDENFLQLYTSAVEAKDENLDEYVEVTGEDLRDLLDEMPDISYFVLNPASNNILIRREEVLGQTLEDKNGAGPEETQDEADKDPEESADQIEEDEDEEDEVPVQSETTDVSSDYEATSSANLELAASAAFNGVAESAEEVKVSEAANIEPEAELKSEHTSDNAKKEKKVKNNMNYEVARTIPQSIIASTLSLAKDGVQKFYLAEENQGDFTSLFFLVGTEHEVGLGEELIGVKSYRKDGSEEAAALENDKFLVFDKEVAKQLAEAYSEDTVLYYLKNHPIVYTTPVQKNETGATEVIAFSDFSQIPELFLNAFDSFELATIEKFNQFLESDEGRVDFVHMNPFTSSLYLKPEAFKPTTVAVQEDTELTSELTIEAEDKKTSILQVLTVLKDFDISNIGLAKDNHLTFVFRKEQDVAIAKQILRMKTDFKLN